MKHLLLTFTALFLLGACANANRTAYVATGVTTATTSQAIHAFDEWRAVHPLTPAQAQLYANLLKAYKDALQAVREARIAAENPLVSTNAYTAATARWNYALDISAAASAKLVAFIADIAPIVANTQPK